MSSNPIRNRFVRLGSPAAVFALLVVLALVVSPVGAGFARAPGEISNSADPKQAFVVEVVSSAADQVTGGDARLHIQVPRTVPVQQVVVLVNGVDQTSNFTWVEDTRTLTGVIDGLEIGENTVTVRPNGQGFGRPRPVVLTLTNYPITGPVFSGPHQYPFVCTVQTTELGQPLVDNDSYGIPVYAVDQNGNPTSQVIGYSKDCSANTKVQFVYKSTAGDFKPYTPGGPRPDDITQTTTSDGLTVDYIVRWEQGTINRFLYSIAMLAPGDTGPGDLSRSAWNGKLIYRFEGGVGIGHSQGSRSRSAMLYDTGLSQGFAILFSTGNRTSVHYNLVLGGETALMVKERFIELYDVPIYTVGIGGSGGAIQQYVYGQNHKGLIDAAIPQYSYPDMVTQAVHVGDCELLEFYMDVLDATNPRWQTWTNRSILEGLNASNTVPNPYTGGQPGNTECINGWRGLSPLALNPHYGSAPGQNLFQPQSAIAAIEWTHFGDIVNIVGVGEDGFARRYWDNVGVQYGLKAVASGQITPDEFLKVNATIGGWKPSAQMVQEGAPFYPGTWDPWSSRNQVFSLDGGLTPAARTEGDIQAMQAAYLSGLVFHGDIDIPIIDWRHYLEDQLNMHNSRQSFASRQRMRNFKGSSDNQVIWFTDARPYGPQFDQTPEALAVIDQWMANIKEHPELGVAGNKPDLAVDRCFDSLGNQIAAGNDVWNGILDDNPPGACTSYFPTFDTSRTVAGGPYEQSIFKCQLKPVAQSIADGDYGVWTPTPAQQTQLEQIFPGGVCDYSLPDAGLPAGW